LNPPCDPASEWQRNPAMRAPRDQEAMSTASRTIVVAMCEATRQPTIILLNASTMKQT
jgi:hypothetical protein